MVVFLLLLTGCSKEQAKLPELGTELKVGIVLVGSESDNGYNYNHIVGVRNACDKYLVPDSNLFIRRDIVQDESSETVMRELAEQGCDIIFATSFLFEDYMLKVAKDYPDIQFCHCSGYKSAQSDLPNVHNYFTKIFEARYLSGIAAGMKAKELGNPQLGYIGAFDSDEYK